MTLRAVYLDASALVKLVIDEAGSDELRAFLAVSAPPVTSCISAVEVPRALARRGFAGTSAAAALTQTGQRDVDREVITAAAALGPASLRSLDAIHLATAASISRQLGALITYDQRMISEAQTLGLPVLSPA